MNCGQIIELLEKNFYEGFAERTCNLIIAENSIEELLDVISELILFSAKENNNISSLNLSSYSKNSLRKIEFRAAYVFEYIYFLDEKYLNKSYMRIVYLFPFVTNESTKRHFAKILSDLLSKKRVSLELEQYEAVASSCVDWIVKDKVRIAVQIWAIECLIIIKGKLDWLPDVLSDILDQLSISPSPGMKVRLKRWR